MRRVADHRISRTKACLGACIVGVGIGFLNCLLQIDFTFRPTLLILVLAAVPVVALLHEGIHGLVAILFGQRPVYGIKPPLVYVTFRNKVPRGRFILVAIAPLLVLDAAFMALYLLDIWRLFADIAFSFSTLGAVGDIWIVTKLLPHKRGAMVRDTKNGVEIWEGDSDSKGSEE